MDPDDYIFNKKNSNRSNGGFSVGTRSVVVNGRRVSYSGGGIAVVNGKVVVEGKSVDVGDELVVNIVVEGDAGDISGEFAKITVAGDATSVNSMSGNVEINGNVEANVKTMSGNVTVGQSVGGNVKTMSGDITQRNSRF